MDEELDHAFIDSRAPATRALLVVAASLFFFVAFRIKSGAGPIGEPVVILVVFGFYVLAFACLFAGITAQYTANIQQAVAYAALALLGVWFLISAGSRGAGGFGTDAILFSRYSIDLLFTGNNPYTHSMAPGFARYSVNSQFVTYKMDGSIVTSLSYPALGFLVFVPQVLLGVPNLNLTTLVVLILVLAFLIRESPPALAVVPPLILIVNPDFVFFSSGGVFDIIWVLPVLISMRYWAGKRYLVAGAALGLAFSVKQLPWLIAPFLGAWLLAESDDYTVFRDRLGRITGLGFLVFLLPNLPFFIDSPTAWMTRVLTPLGSSGDLVIQGTGLSLLSSMGVAILPKQFFLFTELVVLGVAVVIYYLYFERLKWTAWIMPGLIFWFHFRSLQNYYIFFVPIAYYSLLLALRDRHRPSVTVDG